MRVLAAAEDVLRSNNDMGANRSHCAGSNQCVCKLPAREALFSALLDTSSVHRSTCTSLNPWHVAADAPGI